MIVVEMISYHHENPLLGVTETRFRGDIPVEYQWHALMNSVQHHEWHHFLDGMRHVYWTVRSYEE